MPADTYADVAQLKAELRIAATDTQDDVRLDRILEATSRLIDDYCGQHFYLTDSAAIRYYTAGHSDHVWTEPITAVTELAVDSSGDGTWEDVWTVATHYLLAPYDAAEYKRPYQRIEVASASSGKRLPVGVRKGVRVTGRFGWPDVPPNVTEACLIQSTRLFRRADAPFGIASAPNAEGGAFRLLARVDAEVELLLRSFVVEPIGVS